MGPSLGIVAALLLAVSVGATAGDAADQVTTDLRLMAQQGPPVLPPDPTEAGSAPPAAVQPPPPDSGPSRLPRVEFPLDRISTDGTRPPPERLAIPPLDTSRKVASSAKQRQISMLDLRDPFARRDPALARSRTGLVSRLLPDLKDPFAQRGRARAGAFEHLQLPGDIRDPFRGGSSIRQNRNLACNPTTKDGVKIQKPGASAPESKVRVGGVACQDVIGSPDLRDPFPSGTQGLR